MENLFTDVSVNRVSRTVFFANDVFLSTDRSRIEICCLSDFLFGKKNYSPLNP